MDEGVGGVDKEVERVNKEGGELMKEVGCG